jgi:predicted DNA-binding ribbon-helix-helix protein
MGGTAHERFTRPRRGHPRARAWPEGKDKAVNPERTSSSVRKRSVRVGKHKTSLSVEDEFWQGLKEIAQERSLSLSNLVDDINKQRTHANLSSAIRLFVLDHYVTLAKLKSSE